MTVYFWHSAVTSRTTFFFLQAFLYHRDVGAFWDSFRHFIASLVPPVVGIESMFSLLTVSPLTVLSHARIGCAALAYEVLPSRCFAPILILGAAGQSGCTACTTVGDCKQQSFFAPFPSFSFPFLPPPSSLQYGLQQALKYSRGFGPHVPWLWAWDDLWRFQGCPISCRLSVLQ